MRSGGVRIAHVGRNERSAVTAPESERFDHALLTVKRDTFHWAGEVVNSDRAKTDNAIITPPIDAICGGGLSLLVAVVVICYGWLTETGMSRMLVAIELYLFTDLLINWPHFMASYRLLYANRRNFRKHPLVTLVLPAIGLLFLVYVVVWCFQEPAQTEGGPLPLITALEWAAPVFLGWHYTGQSWGMTACFAFLSGLRMNDRERRLIRCGFYALFVYHVAWAYNYMGFVAELLPNAESGFYLMQFILSACRLAVFVGFALGLWGFRQLSQRAGKRIPLRVWLPWIATFSWYVMVDVHPAAFFLLQAFHALQYLTFPVRVEMNQYAGSKHRLMHLLGYYIVLVVLGMLAFDWPSLFGGMDAVHLPIVTATIIVLNLHHYFIDAVIWKIRDPEVRQSLFGHLQPATS
jgi:hypothetical protein